MGSSLSAAYDALDEKLDDQSPVVIALDAADETPKFETKSSIYFKYGTRESLDVPVESSVESQDEVAALAASKAQKPAAADVAAAKAAAPLETNMEEASAAEASKEAAASPVEPKVAE